MRKSASKAHLLSLALMALTATGAASGLSAQAPRPPSPWQITEGDYDIANFKFAAGKSLPNLQFMLIPFGPATVGHGTTMKPKFWKDRVAKLLAE
jgi:hypothetical protein